MDGKAILRFTVYPKSVRLNRYYGNNCKIIFYDIYLFLTSIGKSNQQRFYHSSN